jgi:hypothetical protein
MADILQQCESKTFNLTHSKFTSKNGHTWTRGTQPRVSHGLSPRQVTILCQMEPFTVLVMFKLMVLMFKHSSHKHSQLNQLCSLRLSLTSTTHPWSPETKQFRPLVSQSDFKLKKAIPYQDLSKLPTWHSCHKFKVDTQ